MTEASASDEHSTEPLIASVCYCWSQQLDKGHWFLNRCKQIDRPSLTMQGFYVGVLTNLPITYAIRYRLPPGVTSVTRNYKLTFLPEYLGHD